MSGFDSFAAESDLLGFYITNNTVGDGGSTIELSNFHIYNFNNEKGEKVSNIMVELEQTTKSLA